MYSDGTKDRRRTSRIPTLKARILLVRLFFACQGLKIGINRQPLFIVSIENVIQLCQLRIHLPVSSDSRISP